MKVLEQSPSAHVIVPVAFTVPVAILAFKSGAPSYPTGMFWVVATMCAIGSVFTPPMIYRAFKAAQRLQDVPRSRIRSAALGYVEVHGRARPLGDPLRGPLSGRPCVWYRTRMFRSKKHNNPPPPAGHAPLGTADRAFVIADETGACLVAPLGADVDTEHRTR